MTDDLKKLLGFSARDLMESHIQEAERQAVGLARQNEERRASMAAAKAARPKPRHVENTITLAIGEDGKLVELSDNEGRPK